MTRLLQSSRQVSVLALAWLAFGSAAPLASAQSLLGADPYRPYNSAYESTSIPPGPSVNFDALNDANSRSNSSRANQMGAFYESLYGPGMGIDGQTVPARPGPGSGVPFSNAFRAYDQEFKRIYRPNDTKDDREFRDDQQKRTAEYFEALKESDPRKRAEKLRALEKERLQALRDSELSRRQAPAKKRTRPTQAASAPGATRSRAAQGSSPTSRLGTTPASTPSPRRAVGLPASPRASATPRPPATAGSVAAGSNSPTRPRRTGEETPSEILERALRTDPAAIAAPSDRAQPRAPVTQPAPR